MSQKMEKAEEQDFYKFNSINVYSDTEWLAENKKKFRQVFISKQIQFIYCEFSFLNKQYGKDKWAAYIVLKCEKITTDKPEVICEIKINREIPANETIYYIREGWGDSRTPGYWKKGEYRMYASINGNIVSSKKFFIIDPINTEIPIETIAEIEGISTYEGPATDVEVEDRVYLSQFNVSKTRYVFFEMELINNNIQEEWPIEVFLKVFNSEMELKAAVCKLVRFKKNEDFLTVTIGWGSSIPNSWSKGTYYVVLAMLGINVASGEIVFSDSEIEGFTYFDYSPLDQQKIDNPIKNLSLQQAKDKLSELIGIKDVKKQLFDQIEYFQFLKLRKSKGIKDNETFLPHSIFMGNPGTGKTTVALILGQMYHKLGVLTIGHVHTVDRSQMVGEYIGQTAPKVKEAIKAAKGGILFIDEAYSLSRANDDSKDFGREVIEILIKEMSDGQGDMIIIAAGYPNEMNTFLSSNPGLKSRFNFIYNFPDFQPHELLEIAQFISHRKVVTIQNEVKEVLYKEFVKQYRDRDFQFGNARYVENIITKAKINLGLRIMAKDHDELNNDELSEISIADVVPLIVKPLPISDFKIPIDQELYEECLRKLEAMIGIEDVKNHIKKLAKLVLYSKNMDLAILRQFNLHTVFYGNPGTGKTTVARLLSKIYRALGLLERGHLVETDRQGLVAGFVGQTASKTNEVIDKSIGGILFIDEAYSLTDTDSKNDFGYEAIQTLIKRMEDNRGEFFVIVAGYPENMNRFLKANPGLQSRFDQNIQFVDYTPVELMNIAKSYLATENQNITVEAEKNLSLLIDKYYAERDQNFGNARLIRQMIKSLIEIKNLRGYDALHGVVVTRDFDHQLIIKEDIEQLALMDFHKEISNRKRIGF